MKKRSTFKVILWIGIIIAVLFAWNLNFKKRFATITREITVVKWDNIYEGKNIRFYYLNPQSDNIQKLKEKYNLSAVVAKETDSLKQALAMVKWLNKKVKVSEGAMVQEKNALEVLESITENTKISREDYTAILEEALTAVGIITRKGTLQDKESKDKTTLPICEIWSEKYKKWILIDGVQETYMKEKEMPLSGIEIIEKGVDKVQIVSQEKPKKYIKNYARYYKQYDIAIDNNHYDELKSNAHVQYIAAKEIPQLETWEGFIAPTIFTHNKALFQLAPVIEEKELPKDPSLTLILAKKNINNDTDTSRFFTGGVFQDSHMIESYFISINGSDFMKVQHYFNLEVKEGKNILRLSRDGKKVLREIILEKKKN